MKILTQDKNIFNRNGRNCVVERKFVGDKIQENFGYKKEIETPNIFMHEQYKPKFLK